MSTTKSIRTAARSRDALRWMQSESALLTAPKDMTDAELDATWRAANEDDNEQENDDDDCA